MSNKYYAGIGSRKTPQDILSFMEKIASYLKEENYILRSGGADGADSAFEKGSGDLKEIFLPWKNFNNSPNKFITLPQKAFTIAEKFHPYWYNLSKGVKQLHARNSCQVLGKDLKTPVKFVICWTPNGEMIGGTSQALKIAKFYDVDVYNLANKKDLKYWENKIFTRETDNEKEM